jgi:hypothetical protein
MDDRYCDAIDLCCECIDQTAERDDFVHSKNHIMVKTFRRIHDGEKAWIVPEARTVAERAKKAFQEAESLLARLEGGKRGHSKKSKSKSSHKKTCCCCGEPVSYPCWVCLDCGTLRLVAI